MIIRSKAPLRLGLAGGGTDVSPYSEMFGGGVLNASIDLYAYCTLEERYDGVVSFNTPDLGEYWEGEATETLELDGNLDLHKGVYNRVVKAFNYGIPLSFRMTTYSDVYVGSGLGLSSTMVVAMLKAFDEWKYLSLGDYDMAHLAYEIERFDVGLSGGKQDQYAATFGGFNFMEFYADDRVVVNPLRIKNWIINELETSMILFYTGKSRESAKIIDEQTHNARSGNTLALAAMDELKRDAQIMKESILKGDLDRFAEYLNKSWQAKKKMAVSISTSRIEEIYETALNAGAHAGKVSGAGGGGFMMFIVDPSRRHKVIDALDRFEGKVMNFHFTKTGTQAWRV